MCVCSCVCVHVCVCMCVFMCVCSCVCSCVCVHVCKPFLHRAMCFTLGGSMQHCGFCDVSILLATPTNIS